MNQTLVFNTTTKTVRLYGGRLENSEILFSYDNVPTVAIRDGFYEVMQKENELSYPVLRTPIANTNMKIIK